MVGGGYVGASTAVTASSLGIAVTSGGSANTKGTTVELIAATEQDCYWISVTVVASTPAGTNGLLDILIGASTEQVLIADLQVTNRGTDEGGGGPFLFPLFIAKGSRLSAKYQATGTSAVVHVMVHLFGGNPSGPYAGCSYVDRYGSTTSSTGTSIDPSTANTYSAWTAIANPTLRPIRWLVVTCSNADTAFSAATIWTVEVGIGAATEQTITGDLLYSTGATGDNAMSFHHFYLPVFVPAGSTLSVRVKCNSATAGDRTAFVSLHGAG
jgi:hypothetical protein